MSLLSCLQDAYALTIGDDLPNAFASSTDATFRQFVTYAQYEGDKLNLDAKWRKQKVTASFTGDGTTTVWALPTDFNRFTTEMRRQSSILLGLQGPVSDDEFLDAQVRGFNPTIPYWRVSSDNIETVPAVKDGQTVTFEYVSNYWITDSGGTPKARFTADTDLILLPEILIVLATVYRWKRAKGLDYAQELADFKMECAKQAHIDGGLPRLRMAEGRDYMHPYMKNAYTVITT